MDLDKLAQLARTAHWGDPDPSSWHELSERDQASWRAAADAVRMACETPRTDSPPALRERIIMQLAAHHPAHMPDKMIIDRARAIESYILGDAVS